VDQLYHCDSATGAPLVKQGALHEDEVDSLTEEDIRDASYPLNPYLKVIKYNFDVTQCHSVISRIQNLRYDLNC